MSDLRFSKYAGSKLHFARKFNELASELKCKTYVEPFFGSGAVFFNLDVPFEKYAICDTNKHIVNAVRSFRDGTYETYASLDKMVRDRFGDIKTNKQSYYDFRNWFNAEYFGNGKDPVTEGFLFHFLMNSCINSLVRIGPTGFNQSYGNRLYVMSEGDFSKIKERLTGNVEILCCDYAEALEKFDSESTLFFLDPPYFVRNEVGYQKTYREDDLVRFVNRIKSLRGKVVYTDIECELHSELGWHKEKTKSLANISPNRKTETETQEVFFSNFVPKSSFSPALF